MDVLQFDAAAHRYTLGDRELISVTQALAEAGFIDRTWYSEEAMARGVAVHAAVQQFHADGSAPSDEIAGHFFDAYLKFQAEAEFFVDASEERVCDPLVGYAGTMDLRGRFATRAGVDVIDVKTGAVPAWVGYQTAAYARLVPGPLKRRWVLNLRGDGTYRLRQLTNRSDERVFLAALTVAQAKRGWL